MSLQDYLSLQDQMAGGIAQQTPQLYDSVNDKKVYAKSILETGGNVLGIGALTTGIKKLKKSKGILEKLDMSPEELDAMSDDLKAGNYKDVLAKISKKAINKASARLEGAIQKARGINPEDGDLSEDVVATPIRQTIRQTVLKGLNNSEEIPLSRAAPQVNQESTARFKVPKRKIKVPDEDEAGGLKGDPNIGKMAGEADEAGEFDLFSGARLAGTAAQRTAPKLADLGDLVPDLPGLKPVMTVRVLPSGSSANLPRAAQARIQSQPKPQPPKPADEPTVKAPTNDELNNAVRAADNDPITQGDADALAGKFVKAGGKVASEEEDASKIMGDLLKGSEADDDNPVGLAITAVLGIGSLIAGGLEKTHHNAFQKPPPGPIKGFSAQIGAGI